MITIKTRTHSNVCAEYDPYIILIEHWYFEETDMYSPKLALYNPINGIEQNTVIDWINNNYRIYSYLYHDGLLRCLGHEITSVIITIIELSHNCNGFSITGHRLAGVFQRDYTLENTRIIPNSLGDYFVQLGDEYRYFSSKLKRDVEVDEFIRNKHNVVSVNNENYVMIIGKQNSSYDKFAGINMCEEKFQYSEYLAVGLPLNNQYRIVAQCNPRQSISIDSISGSKICYSILDYDRNSTDFIGKRVSYEFCIQSNEIKQISDSLQSENLVSEDEFFIRMGDYKVYSPKKVCHIPDGKMFETDIGMFQCFNNHLYLIINSD